MNAIVCVDKNYGIGKDNNLLVHIPEDMKFFRNTTIKNTIVMGRKTYESIGKALPNRRNIVISRNEDLNYAGTEVYNLEEFEEAIKNTKDTSSIFVIGGESIYNQLKNLIDTIYITRYNAEFSADKHFFIPEQNGFKQDSIIASGEYEGIEYSIEIWKRV